MEQAIALIPGVVAPTSIPRDAGCPSLLEPSCSQQSRIRPSIYKSLVRRFSSMTTLLITCPTPGKSSAGPPFPDAPRTSQVGPHMVILRTLYTIYSKDSPKWSAHASRPSRELPVLSAQYIQSSLCYYYSHTLIYVAFSLKISSGLMLSVLWAFVTLYTWREHTQ